MPRSSILTLLATGLAAACYDQGTGPAVPPPPPPLPPVFAVTMGPADALIAVGGRLQYQAVSNTTVASWEWSVSDPARGTVSSDGTFLAVSPGPVQVRACASNAPGICGSVDATVVQVVGGVPSITVTPASPTIGIGQTVEFFVTAGGFTAPGWTWVSLDNNTATITDTGILTGRRAGISVVAACSTGAQRYCGSAQVRVQ